MSEMHKLGLKIIEEDEANEHLQALYERFKRDFQIPNVPNYIKGFGESPATLEFYLDMMGSYYANISLPQSLLSMIAFTIAKKANCAYCSAFHEVTCRTLGVDETTLTALSENLGEVNPERIRAIIEFALKAAKYPQTIVSDDYQSLRDLGISNDEIVQIIFVAGMGVFSDILADSTKLTVDKDIIEALAN